MSLAVERTMTELERLVRLRIREAVDGEAYRLHVAGVPTATIVALVRGHGVRMEAETQALLARIRRAMLQDFPGEGPITLNVIDERDPED